MSMTPHTARTLAARIAYTCAPCALLYLAAWGLQLLPNPRPALAAALYVTLLVVSASAGAVWLVASALMATQRAFAAGYETGRAAAERRPPATRKRSLHVVE